MPFDLLLISICKKLASERELRSWKWFLLLKQPFFVHNMSSGDYNFVSVVGLVCLDLEQISVVRIFHVTQHLADVSAILMLTVISRIFMYVVLSAFLGSTVCDQKFRSDFLH